MKLLPGYRALEGKPIETWTDEDRVAHRAQVALWREEAKAADARERPNPEKPTVYPIGTFETTGKLWVSDPCYDIKTRCTHTLEHVSPGTWNASILFGSAGTLHGHPDSRVFEIIVEHAESRQIASTLDWEHVDADIGVDSGQAGFFDYEKRVTIGDDPDTHKNPVWNDYYDNVCSLTHVEGKRDPVYDWRHSWGWGGIHENWAAVASSGFGDGGYDLYVKKLLGYVVAAA